MKDKRNIIVVDYDEQWPLQYMQAAQEISAILQGELLAIYHIGSTSVPQLAAKPIIDIMPVVKDIRKVDDLQGSFEQLGYTAMGEYEIPGRRFFIRGLIARTHHVHIFEETNKIDIERHLALREYLKVHPEARDAYGSIKKQLASKFPHDIDHYCDGKDSFVKELERNALLWYRKIQN